jgi:hypothetical protein
VNVQLREVSPGAYRIDHAHGRHDDMAIAVAMCAAHLVDKPVGSHYGSSADLAPMPFLRGYTADNTFDPHSGWGNGNGRWKIHR